MSDFLEKIVLNDGTWISYEERQEIQNLGVESPQELLATLRADRTASRLLFGSARSSAISLERVTGDHSTPAEVARRRPRFATGALVHARRPKLASPAYDLSERDRLFAELQTLRSQTQPSAATCERIEELESQLNRLLEAVAEPAR